MQSGITTNVHWFRRLGLLNCASDWPNHLLMWILQVNPPRRDLARSRCGPSLAICLVQMGGAVNSPALPHIAGTFICVKLRFDSLALDPPIVQGHLLKYHISSTSFSLV